jgi:hypothetical protein
MSLPALMSLMPTLPASAQPSERQPPLPPVELPDEMASRDSVRRGPAEPSGPQSRAIPVNGTTQVADAGVDMTPRKLGVVLSPAGINPRLLAMAFTQPIIQRLLANWSEGPTVSLSIPANPGLPEPLAKALAQAASPALMKAILAVGMRQDGVVLAAQPATQTLGTPWAEASQPKFLLAVRGEPIAPTASIAQLASTDDPRGARNAELTPADTLNESACSAVLRIELKEFSTPMSLPASMPLMPTLPASAQPSERQPPLPPVELPDEMASRDSVDGRGRATFIPRGEESAQTSDSVRRGPAEPSGPRSRASPVSRTTQASDTGAELTSRKPGVVLSPAGINPRLLAMTLTQPIIQRLLGGWSEGRTVTLSIPASPGLPEPLAEALAQAVSPALLKAILAVGMRQDGVLLAQAATKEAALTDHPSGAVTTHQSGAVAGESTPAEVSSPSTAASTNASTNAPTAASTNAPTAASTEGKRDAATPPITVSLTLLPLPVQPDRPNTEREPNRKRGGQQGGDSESGISGSSTSGRIARMLRGQVDLGPRGQLNFEIRSLNGRFSVALGATPDLGVAARPVLPALEEALHRLPGFTELHWNG